MTSPQRQYLLDYLAEEFREFPDVRVRQAPSKRYEGPDGSAEVADSPGVFVRTEAREYFFPYEWAEPGQFSEVARLVRVIKDVLDK